MAQPCQKTLHALRLGKNLVEQELLLALDHHTNISAPQKRAIALWVSSAIEQMLAIDEADMPRDVSKVGYTDSGGGGPTR